MIQPIKSRRKRKAGLNFVATCAAGLEKLVVEEILEHGGSKPESNRGAVAWEGNLESGYRMCLWSRYASRVLLEISSFAAPDPDTLYKLSGKLDWDEHFSGKTTFAVFSTVTDSPITHSKYAALRVKDAIVDQFRSRSGRRPTVDLEKPGIRINLHLRGEKATLAIDLSGESLHRRGYRIMGVEAPLKETLAAGIVHLAGFTRHFSADSILLDPMCGSGTLLIEAAMMYGDVAPGLQRKTFGFLGWKKHDPTLWKKLVNEAVQREEAGLEKPWPRLIGFDADPLAVKASRRNIEASGLEEKIQVNQRQLAFLKRPMENGMMLINPPYGERLSEKEQVKYLYRCIGRKIAEEMYNWRVGFFSANPDIAGSLKMKWDENIPLFNGPIKCKLHIGTARKHDIISRSCPAKVKPDAAMEGSDLAKRIIKNYSLLQEWVQREDITCFRIYDAEIPVYNFAIDLYEEWVHIVEYAPPSQANAIKAQHKKLQIGLRTIRHVLDIPHSRLFIKSWKGQKEKAQSQKKSQSQKLFEVREQQCRFLVNLTDQSDTGLFLNYRTTRTMIGREARGKKFLNLFGSAGSSTVHALMNNALSTTTIDTQRKHVLRARANFALNGFGGPQHQVIEQDCIKWLEKCQERYALIFVDPPAYLADKQQNTTFSIQKDHERLLQLCMKRLARTGLLIFSSRFRKFQLAASLQKEFAVHEITGETIPADFKNSLWVHRCWEFRHREQAP